MDKENSKDAIAPVMTANNIVPTYNPHPGEILKDEIEFRGISQKALADEIGMSTSVLNEVINGKRAVSTEYALLFEAALGIDADVWLNLQSRYNKIKARSDQSFMERIMRIRKAAAFL